MKRRKMGERKSNSISPEGNSIQKVEECCRRFFWLLRVTLLVILLLLRPL